MENIEGSTVAVELNHDEDTIAGYKYNKINKTGDDI